MCGFKNCSFSSGFCAGCFSNFMGFHIWKKYFRMTLDSFQQLTLQIYFKEQSKKKHWIKSVMQYIFPLYSWSRLTIIERNKRFKDNHLLLNRFSSKSKQLFSLIYVFLMLFTCSSGSVWESIAFNWKKRENKRMNHSKCPTVRSCKMRQDWS